MLFTGLENGIGLDIVVWLQAHGSGFLDVLAKALNVTGGSVFALIVGPLIYWVINRRLGLQMLLMLLAGALLATVTKEIAQTPRPFVAHPDEVTALFDARGYGFPSGHVMNAIAFWFPVVVMLKRRAWWWVYGGYVLLMAWSRMYAGVHYPQSVIGSMIMALPLIALFLRWQPDETAFRASRLVGALVIVPWVLLPFLRSYEDGVTTIGTLFGFGLALAWTRQHAGFSVEAAVSRRALRYGLGVVLLFAIFLGLDVLFGTAEPDYVFRMVRYAAVTLFVIAAWPVLWHRARL